MKPGMLLILLWLLTCLQNAFSQTMMPQWFHDNLPSVGHPLSGSATQALPPLAGYCGSHSSPLAGDDVTRLSQPLSGFIIAGDQTRNTEYHPSRLACIPTALLPSSSISRASDTPCLTVELVLNQSHFKPGDHFLLELIADNPSTWSATVDGYILLQIMDEYYCYPEWENINVWRCGETYTFLPGLTIITILDFIWPQGSGSSVKPLFFHGALFQPGCLNISCLLGLLPLVSFEYSE